MIQFDPTISLGNILTVLGFVLSAFIAWHRVKIEITEAKDSAKYLKDKLDEIIKWKDRIDEKMITGETIIRLDLADKQLREDFADMRSRFQEDHHRLRGLEQRMVAVENHKS